MMKRELVFEGDKAQKRFELLYGAVILVNAASTTQPVRGIEVIRREAKILDYLDSVSLPDPASGTMASGEPARAIIPGSKITFDQPTFDLLKKRVEDCAWVPKIARDVVDLVDWMSSAREVTPVFEKTTD